MCYLPSNDSPIFLRGLETLTRSVLDAEIGFWAFWESANFGKDAVAGGIEYSLSRLFKGSSIGSSPATLGKAHVDDHAFN
jgi:hypothetical protein